MNAVIIGSGNVATHLAKALKEADVQISQIWSRNPDHAGILANVVDAEAISNLNDVRQADFCFIAVKDEAIASIIDGLKDFQGIVAHTAGAVDLAIFKSRYANYGVFYPLQTFSKAKAISFQSIPICIEANNQQTKESLLNLAKKLSQKVSEISTAQRKLLHVSAVFACNFPNYLYSLAHQFLAQHQLDFELIRPLILETAEKVQTNLPEQVQTGPAIRRDEKTMQEHLTLLHKQPELTEIYTLLSSYIKSGK